MFSCMNCSREPHLLLLMARKIVSLRFLSKYNMWLTVSIDASNYDSVTQRNDLLVTTAYLCQFCSKIWEEEGGGVG